MPRDDEVKLIAYRIWEEEGCCHGRDVDNWLRAEVIWEQQQTIPQSTTVKKTRRTSTKTAKSKTSTQKKA